MLIECKEFEGELWVPIDRVQAAINMAVENERKALFNIAEKQLHNTAALMSFPAKSSAAWNIMQEVRDRNWPFPPATGPIPWTAKQIQEYAKEQRRESGEALW